MKYFLLQIQKDSLDIDTIQIATESTSNYTDPTNAIWFWISLLELVIIFFITYKLIKKKKNLDFSELDKDKIKNVKKTSIDMDNLMDSINNSKALYKQLSRVCHPDRFIGTDKISIAEDIFQELSKNRRDYKKLLLVKERAIKELKITF